VIAAATCAIHGHGTLTLLTVAVGAALAVRARAQFSLAERAAVGVRAEKDTERELRRFARRDCWEVAHNVPWPGRGDIDSVVIAPGGPVFVIETKAKSFNSRHLARAREAAATVAAGSPTPLASVAILATSAGRRVTVENGVTVCCIRDLATTIDGLYRAHHRSRGSR
jgi:hypothetical protein